MMHGAHCCPKCGPAWTSTSLFLGSACDEQLPIHGHCQDAPVKDSCYIINRKSCVLPEGGFQESQLPFSSHWPVDCRQRSEHCVCAPRTHSHSPKQTLHSTIQIINRRFKSHTMQTSASLNKWPTSNSIHHTGRNLDWKRATAIQITFLSETVEVDSVDTCWYSIPPFTQSANLSPRMPVPTCVLPTPIILVAFVAFACSGIVAYYSVPGKTSLTPNWMTLCTLWVSFASMFYTSNFGELYAGVVNCTASTIPDNELAQILESGGNFSSQNIIWDRLLRCLRLDTFRGEALNAKYRMVMETKGEKGARKR